MTGRARSNPGRWGRAPGQHLAAADCEADSGRWLAQPVNSLSSLAATAAGGWVIVRATRAGGARRSVVRVAGVAIALNGPGGLAYHGPGGRPGKALHDAALVATVVSVLAVETLDTVGPTRTDPARRIAGIAGPALLLAAGAAVHARSRTGCRWCRPHSLLQGHALWHLLSAAALGWWGTRAAARINSTKM